MTAALISAQKLIKAFGGKPLFEEITLVVAEEERLALVGPNGSGKSTLLKMLLGLEEPDRGEVARRRGIRLGYVAQQPILSATTPVMQLLREAALTVVRPDHEQDSIIQRVSRELQLSDLSAQPQSLSGGWRKRVAIACELVKEPDLLLLDEPTNHLDIEGILWLEQFLESAPFALCFISHDRYFIEKLAKRVVEVNRRYPCGTFSAAGGYSDFLLAREQYLEQLDQTQRNLANKVRREVEWLRQGAKARTTKSKHRSAEAHRMVGDLNAMNISEQRAALQFSSTQRKTKELVVFHHVGKSLGGKRLFHDVSLTLSPGTRLGVIGPNGSGKTTFIKTVTGEISADEGHVVRAAGLRLAFFDQERKQLDPSQSLLRALCENGDAVVFNGRQYHAAAWAKRFLFHTDQLSMPVSNLSGGEQARVLLARLMRQEADVLIFDEPTNDLDIQTLEILEESFASFSGAIVLVTHDRYFMDRVASEVLGLGRDGRTHLYADYSQWEIARGETERAPIARDGQMPFVKRSSYDTQKEVQALERKIEKEERKLAALKQKLSDPDVAHDHAALTKCYDEVHAQQNIIDDLLSKWEGLLAEN